MTERISRHVMMMRMAFAASERSTCQRRQVGAIIAREGRPLSIGYAGSPPGFPHCTPETCNSEKPCVNTTHAEANAIAWAARTGVSVEGATLYCTLSPCDSCAKLILAAGIGLVIFQDRYRIADPIALLIQGHIPVGTLIGNRVQLWENHHVDGLRLGEDYLRRSV